MMLLAALSDMGWEISFFKIHESQAQRPIDKFVGTLEKWAGSWMEMSTMTAT